MKTATFHSPGTPAMGDVSSAGFSMSDLVIVPQRWLRNVSNIFSDRYAAVASHHFPFVADFSVSLSGPRLFRAGRA